MLSVLKENMLQLMKKMGNQSRDIHNIKEMIEHFKTKRNTIPKLKFYWLVLINRINMTKKKQ